MTERLTGGLHAIADRAPALDLPDDVWARGRRARRRDRWAAGVAVAAVLAVVAGVGVGFVSDVSTEAPPAGTSTEGAVPSEIHGVPERLTHFGPRDGGAGITTWDPRVGETDLAIGRASVAFTNGLGDELAVVVTASDGVYHPLDLPDFAGGSVGLLFDGSALALSPDGRHLAYSHARPAAGREDYAPVPSGIRLVDLVTGEVRTISLSHLTGDAQATVAGRLVWSPDSRWLAWTGRRLRQFNSSGSGAGPRSGVAGVIEPGSDRSRPLPDSFSEHALAVTDAGVVVSGVRGEYAVWDDGLLRRTGKELVRYSEQASVGAVSPDNRHVLLPRSRPGRSVPVLDLETSQVLTSEVPAEVGDVVAQPLGWIDEELMVVQISKTFDHRAGGWSSEAPVIAVMSAPTAPGPSTFRIVSQWASDDIPAPAGLWLAVDLMTAERPTAEFPEPDWPWSDERKVATGALAVLAAGGAAYLLFRWRRRTT